MTLILSKIYETFYIWSIPHPIIKYLSNEEASNQEIYEALNKTLTIKYRSAIYGALKDLQEMGLIEKYYDNLDSKIKYRLIIKKVHIDLEKLKISFTQ